MNPEDVLQRYIFSLAGKEYLYGGQGPNFDCSGLVIELMKAYGYLFPHDMTAQQIFSHISPTSEWGKRKFGSIAFYGNSTGAIHHVGFCLNAVQMVEAGGGDSTTLTKESAQKRGAFTRIRPIDYRKDIAAVLAPKYPWK